MNGAWQAALKRLDGSVRSSAGPPHLCCEYKPIESPNPPDARSTAFKRSRGLRETGNCFILHCETNLTNGDEPVSLDQARAQGELQHSLDLQTCEKQCNCNKYLTSPQNHSIINLATN